MSFSIEVQADPMTLKWDSLAVVNALVHTHAELCRRSLLSGNTPDGRSLPRNKQGQPMGRGDGSIATDWQTTTATGTPGFALASTGPFMDDGHRYVIWRLEDMGSSVVSTEGRAGALIDAQVARFADEAVRL